MNTATASAAITIDRKRIGKMLMRLFEHWKLSSVDQLSLLGLSKDNRGALSKYRNGQPLANDRDKLERAASLLAIHKALRLLFPHNPGLAYDWMSLPNRAFNGLTPVQLIDQQGMIGIYMVRNYLDRQRGH